MTTYEHFAQRLLERYELPITREEYKQLCDSDHTFVNKKYGRCRVIVHFKGAMIYALTAGGSKKRLVTALPIEKLHNHLNTHLFKK